MISIGDGDTIRVRQNGRNTAKRQAPGSSLELAPAIDFTSL
jgi:hypothetical protein